jgi:glucosamine--fructose-6-phosphate aminotransferase (isomerizing)
VYLDDEQIAILPRKGELIIKTIKNKRITPYIQELQLQLESIEKGGYDHFMLKEIFEQPRSIKDSMRGRINAREGVLALGGIRDYIQKFTNTRRIIIIGCGTSWHAGLVAEYLFEDLARIPVEVEYASEFRYRNPVIDESDVVIAISQSGETADTLAAIELAKSKGATIFGVCNVVGSSIARATHAGSYTHAGPEIGVASTKAFTLQALTGYLIGLAMKGSLDDSLHYSEIKLLSNRISDLCGQSDFIKDVAEQIYTKKGFIFTGRGKYFPIALEGALKLKEIAYVHAEGYAAGELKHGPIALIDEEMPVVVIATNGGNYEKVVSNIQEVKARKGTIIAVVTEGDKQVKEMVGQESHIGIITENTRVNNPVKLF